MTLLPPRTWLLSLLLPVGLIALWQHAVAAGWVPETLIASPGDVATDAWEMTRDGTLIDHALVSLRRLALGFAIGTGAGAALGIAVGTSRRFARVVEPTFLALIPIPAVAWIPLLIIVLGIGESSKVALVAVGGFCTLFLQAAFAVRNVDSAYVDVARSLAKPRRTVLFRVLVPAALPNILSALRVAMALSWTLLVSAEVVASASGLGWLIWDARTFARPADMIVGMIAIGLLGKATDMLIVAGTARATRWQRTYVRSSQ